MARASAPAMRNAVPLFSTDWLPAVCPSLGVRPVSPDTMMMRSSGRASSSAANWRSAGRIPCPSSTLPVNTVAVPSALMRSQPSSRRLVCRLPGRRAASWASVTAGSSVKATTIAPRPVVNRRRLMAIFISRPPHLGRGVQDRRDDPIVGAAAAQVAVQAGPAVLLARVRIAVEQRLGGHDHAVDAVTALSRLLGDEGALQRMRFLDRTQAFDRGDGGIAERADGSDAGTRRLAVDQHRSGAALGKPAAEFGAVERKVVAQHVEQRRIRLGRHRAALAVDVQTDGHGVKISLSGGGAAAFLAYGCSHCARRSYWRPGGCGRRRRASQVGLAKAYRTDVCRSDKPCPRGSTSQQSHAATLDSAGTEPRAKR